jgi:hypothetical protein
MNSKIKISVVGLALVFGAVALLGAGCASKVADLAGGGQLTDEGKCIEFMAHGLLAPSFMQDMAKLTILQQKLDGLKAKYNWSDDDISKICEPVVEQEGFMERVAPRMKQVMEEIK